MGLSVMFHAFSTLGFFQNGCAYVFIIVGIWSSYFYVWLQYFELIVIWFQSFLYLRLQCSYYCELSQLSTRLTVLLLIWHMSLVIGHECYLSLVIETEIGYVCADLRRLNWYSSRCHFNECFVDKSSLLFAVLSLHFPDSSG